MSEKIWTAIRTAVVAAAFGLAVVALYVWYNKDRYQYVHYVRDKYQNVEAFVFDKNTGTSYEHSASGENLKINPVAGKLTFQSWQTFKEK